MQIVVQQKHFAGIDENKPAAALIAIDHPGGSNERELALKTMAEKAIAILSKNEKGFVLLVEGSQIDWAGHKNDEEKVIREMHRQFFDGKERYREQDPALPKAVLCDLDGTLAILNGRDPYVADKCEGDLLNVPVANILLSYKEQGRKIILLSGRSDLYQPQTLNWLEKHAISYDH